MLTASAGTDKVRFGHHVDTIVYSGAHDGILRYHSLYDNRHLRYFQGHSSQYVADAFLFECSVKKSAPGADLPPFLGAGRPTGFLPLHSTHGLTIVPSSP